MKKWTLCLLSLTALGALGSQTASAVVTKSVPDFQIQSVTSSSAGVNLSWSSGADHYAVYQGQQLVYQGQDHQVQVGGASADMNDRFQVVAYDAKGNVIGKSYVQAENVQDHATVASVVKKAYAADDTGKLTFQTDAHGQVVLQNGVAASPAVETLAADSVEVASAVNAAINASSVVLNWAAIPGVKSYQVLRDGKQLGTTTKGEFVDRTVKAGQSYTYEIVATRPMDASRTQHMNQFVKDHHMVLTANQKTAAYNDTFDLIKLVNTSGVAPSALQQKAGAPFALTPDWSYSHPSFYLEYTCFLPGKYVPNPWNAIGTATYAYFGGDGENRDFDPYSDAYRTRSAVSAGFASAGRYIGMSPSVGLSHGYDKNHKLIGTGRASSNGITMDTPYMSSSKIKYTIDHSVGNPLTYAPAIDYSYTGTLYSDGHVSFSGWHDKAPSHEVYLFSPYYKVLHQDWSDGLGFLLPGLPKTHWSYSN